YSALHGCAFGLLSVAFLVKSIRSQEQEGGRRGEEGGETRRRGEGGKERRGDAQTEERFVVDRYFLMAGISAGLAMLSKTEMGFAALISGVAAGALGGYPKPRKSATLVAIFLLPAIAIITSVYSIIAFRVGWDTLSRDSFLFLRSLPPELVYFNKRISGFDQPVQSLIQMSVAAIRLILLAMVAAATGLVIGGGRGTEGGNALPIMAEAGGRDSGAISAAQLWFLLVASLALFFLLPVAGAIGWDKGPYLAMPFILLALLIVTARQAKSEIDRWGTMSGHTL